MGEWGGEFEEDDIFEVKPMIKIRSTNMKPVCKTILLIIFLNIISIAAKAAVHYVSPTGTATWTASTNINTPCSLPTANANVNAGDTVSMRGGIYNNTIQPSNSGNQTQHIIYMNYGSEEPVITGTSRAIYINKRSYITVSGITGTSVDTYIFLDSCQYIWIYNCLFDSANSTGGWPTGVRIRNNAQYNRITDCFIGRVGYCTADDDKGGVITIGTWENTNDHCDYNLLENNTICYGGHHLIEVVGRYNVFRNNYFHNEGWMDCSRPGGKCGNRAIVVGYDPIQCRQNLFEEIRFAFSGLPPDQNTSASISIRTPYNIVRRNVFYYNDGPGLDISTSDSSYDTRFNKVYNNSFYHNGYTLLPAVEQWKQVGMLVAKHGNSTPTTNLSIKNNIFYDNKITAIQFYYVLRDSQIVENNWEHTGDPSFEDIEAPIVPENPQKPDLRLKSNSLCRDAGTFLTTVSSPSGSGSSFQVADAGYFMDGWGIPGVEGDEIQLEGSTQRARITDVNYETNEITLDQSLSWTQGQGVCLAYIGNNPDIGAYEYGASSTPIHIDLKPNYPNPFHLTTTIPYIVTEHGHIKLAIYDLIGREIKILTEGYLLSGNYSIDWDGTDKEGKRVKNGIYFCKISGESGNSDSNKMIFLK
jgi:hypothetical protein